MNRLSTTFLQGAVLILGLVVLAGCLLVLAPALLKEDDWEFRILIVGMLIAAVPFFVALIQTLKLLNVIDGPKAFSPVSVAALKVIKYCALAIGAVYLALLPVFFYIADTDDAPGVVLIGLVFVFASSVVAVFAATLHKLLRNAIRIKSENDLTV